MTGKQNFSIRPAESGDYKAVNRLLLALHHADYLGSPRSPLKKNPPYILSANTYNQLLQQSTTQLFVAVADQTIVGVIYLFIEETSADNETTASKQPVIGSLYIEDKYRCQGLGSKLLQRAERWARRYGTELSTIVYGYNTEAQMFLQEHGYSTRSLRLNKDLE